MHHSGYRVEDPVNWTFRGATTGVHLTNAVRVLCDGRPAVVTAAEGARRIRAAFDDISMRIRDPVHLARREDRGDVVQEVHHVLVLLWVDLRRACERYSAAYG